MLLHLLLGRALLLFPEGEDVPRGIELEIGEVIRIYIRDIREQVACLVEIHLRLREPSCYRVRGRSREYHTEVISYARRAQDPVDVRRVDDRRHMGGEYHNVDPLLPVCHVLEALFYGLQDQVDILGVHLVPRGPLEEYAAGVQVLVDYLVELPREEHGDAGDPDVRRLGNDGVVFVGSGLGEIAAVVDVHPYARVVERVVVEVLEVGAGRLDDERVYLDHVDDAYVRVALQCPHRKASAEAYVQHPLRVPVHEERHVADEYLRAHVIEARRRVHLAVMEELDLVRSRVVAHGYEAVEAVLGVGDLLLHHLLLGHEALYRLVPYAAVVDSVVKRWR